MSTEFDYIVVGGGSAGGASFLRSLQPPINRRAKRSTLPGPAVLMRAIFCSIVPAET